MAMDRKVMTVDANEAAAMVAHRSSEVIVIYPITPSSPMGEFADEWSSRGQMNIWGTVPHVLEMQSEAGAAGSVHGVRQAGFAMLASASVQEAHDMACIAQAATLKSRVPFLHFFDGFRTSHEVSKIEELTDDDLRKMLPDELIAAHR